MMAARQRRNDDYYNRANYYNNSSLAVEALPVEEAPALPVKKPKRKVSRGTKEVTEDETDKSARPSLLIVAAVLLIAAGAFLIIAISSYVSMQSRENNALRSDLQALQMRTGELAALAAVSVDLDEVERIARTRLGMNEPQIHQIRHISVPWQGITPSAPAPMYAGAGYDDDSYAFSLAETSIFSSFINIFARD